MNKVILFLCLFLTYYAYDPQRELALEEITPRNLGEEGQGEEGNENGDCAEYPIWECGFHDNCEMDKEGINCQAKEEEVECTETIEGCLKCRKSDSTKCIRCDTNLFVDDKENKCLPCVVGKGFCRQCSWDGAHCDVCSHVLELDRTDFKCKLKQDSCKIPDPDFNFIALGGSNCQVCDPNDLLKCGTCGDTYEVNKYGFCYRNGDEQCKFFPGCKKCVENDDIRCEECEEGYKLSGLGICLKPKIKNDCSNFKDCKECDEEKCTECNEGFDKDEAGECKKKQEVKKGEECLLNEELHCETCFNKNKCASCKKGYKFSFFGSKCEEDKSSACFLSEDVDPNCISCDRRDSEKCGYCKKGFTLDKETRACNVKKGFACFTNENIDPLCKSCDPADETVCGRCLLGFDLTEEKECVMKEGFECLTQVEHCAVCNPWMPWACLMCEENYHYTFSGKCKADRGSECVTGNNPIPGCLFCDYYEPEKCGFCLPFFKLSDDQMSCELEPGSACKAGENAIEYCKECKEDDETQCGECEEYYELNGDGLCVPQKGTGCITGSKPIDGCIKCADDDEFKCQECGVNYDLEDGNCKKKKDDACRNGDFKVENCAKCNKDNYTECARCDNRYFLTEEKTCELCSDFVGDTCLKCSSAEVCTKCMPGFIAIEGRCVPLTEENMLLAMRPLPGLGFGLRFRPQMRPGWPFFFFSPGLWHALIINIIRILILGRQIEITRESQADAIELFDKEEDLDAQELAAEEAENDEGEGEGGEEGAEIEDKLIRRVRRLTRKLAAKVKDFANELDPEGGDTDVNMEMDGEVSALDNGFKKNTELADFSVSNANAGGLSNLNNLFSGCSSLETVDLANMPVENLDGADGMFSGCRTLESADLSSINFVSKPGFNIADMLKDCQNLKQLSLDEKSAQLFASNLGLDLEGVTDFEKLGNGTWVAKACNPYYFLNEEERRCYKCGTAMKGCEQCATQKVCLKCEGNLISQGDKCVTEDELSASTNLEIVGLFDLYTPANTYLYGNPDIEPDRQIKDNKCMKVVPNQFKQAETRQLNEKAKIFRKVQADSLSTIKIQFDEVKPSLEGFFKDVETLQEVTVTKAGKAGDITNIKSMFQNCKNLKKADLREIKSAKLNDIQGLFAGINAESIDLTGIETEATFTDLFDDNTNILNIAVKPYSGFKGVDQLATSFSVEGGVPKVASCPEGFVVKDDKCEEEDERKSYKSAFIVFLILFIISFIACGAVGYFYYRRVKGMEDYGHIYNQSTPTFTK